MNELTPPKQASFFEALKYWLKLGFISFGGPAGQISIMHQELVEKRRWISENRFLHALNYCMLLPGPEAQQLATYIGWLLHGVRGGIAAGVLFVLPSLVLLIGLTWLYLVFGDVPAVAGVLYGVKPAVTAIVLFAAYRIGSRALPNYFLKGMALLAFCAIFVFSVPFPFIVIMAGLIGYIGSRFLPELFNSNNDASTSSISSFPALIDDHSAIPLHAQFRWRKAILFLAVGLGIWFVSMLVLSVAFGWHNPLTQMGWFFTKAALMTFGGAYAVLPYVYQGGVEEYAWLTGTQMMDGLALGETTPGPLIMVVSFVGFVGGWTKEVFGVEGLFLAGVAGASVATLFTFLPSFLFILIGGPAVEATRGNLNFTAPLKGITAAVVGVILNLAVFFAYHVIWPQGSDNSVDWLSCVIGVAALIALIRFKIGIIPVILGCAFIGLCSSFFLARLALL